MSPAMARDPLETLARLRETETLDARRGLARAEATLARERHAAAAAEAALRAETPEAHPATYGAFLADGLARRQACAAAVARAVAAAEEERGRLAETRRAEKVLGLLRGRRAATERRAAQRRDQARLEDALPRG
jgi:hypothetical protein